MDKIKRPPVLYAETQKLIQRIEALTGTPFLAYWNSTNGSVCANDVVGFYELLKSVGHKKRMMLFIKSDGGSGKASLRIVHLLRQYSSKLIAVVPLECVSAATMIALGADEIHMGPMAYLSAVDTSLTHDLSPLDRDNNRVSVSQNELSRILKLWEEHEKNEADANPFKSIFQYIHPLVIGAVDRASSLSIRLCREILSYHMKDAAQAEKVSQMLNEDYPSHSYPITLVEAKRVGLNVTELAPALNDLLIELNELYSEMGQRAITDFDEKHHHDNEILNIIEARDLQVFYQVDKDWHYREQERRWIALNDQSSWRRMEMVKGKLTQSVFHIR